MIDIDLGHDNMHKNVTFYALICIKNHIISFVNYTMYSLKSGCSLEKEFTELMYINH